MGDVDVAPGVVMEPTDVAAPPSPTIVVEDAHVTYRVYEDRRRGLRAFVSSRFKSRRAREIRAVRGVSFTAYTGEVIGIIGPNGSGKSSLLTALAGLLPLSSGAVYARSQPVLLGVNAALKPRLSGRRNIELGGLALGMSGKQLSERLGEIIAFSGLDEFIDLPLRTYSSGMRARLHFSIATAVNPDILMIDEALAVGDKDFRGRSQQRVRDLQQQAGTVLVVSHSLREIRKSCTRVLWLSAGELVADGAPAEVVKAYRRSMSSPPKPSKWAKKRGRKRRRRAKREDGQARAPAAPGA